LGLQTTKKERQIMNPITINSRYGAKRTIECIDHEKGIFKMYGQSHFTRGGEGMFDFEGGPMLEVGEQFYGFGTIAGLSTEWIMEDARCIAEDLDNTELGAVIYVSVDLNKKTILSFRRGENIELPKQDKSSIDSDLQCFINSFYPINEEDKMISPPDDIYLNISKMLADIATDDTVQCSKREDETRKILSNAKEEIKKLRHHIKIMSECRVTSSEMGMLQDKSSEMVKIWKAAEHKIHGDSDKVRKNGWGKGKDE
jgi:hypothetical protein